MRFYRKADSIPLVESALYKKVISLIQYDISAVFWKRSIG